MEEEVLKTIQTYNEYAEKYFQSHHSAEAIKNLLELFIENLDGKRILDVGCGPGRDAKFFADLGYEVVGIDLSEKLLEIARKNVPKAKFYLMDMRNLDFPNNYFDGIWACASFLHVPRKDAQKTLNEFYRVLRENGLIYISVREGRGERFVKSKQYGEKERYFVYYSSVELRKLIENGGFKVFEELIEKEKDGDTWINIFARK